jgi:hypothetical protein
MGSRESFPYEPEHQAFGIASRKKIKDAVIIYVRFRLLRL